MQRDVPKKASDLIQQEKLSECFATLHKNYNNENFLFTWMFVLCRIYWIKLQRIICYMLENPEKEVCGKCNFPNN